MAPSLPNDPPPHTGSLPTFGEATRLWARIGLINFGGPSAQIALMHRLLVDERRWIGDAQFLHALNFCMLLPGPEAQQLATYVGWLLHGTRGGLVAGILFVLPGFLVILLLSALYALYHEVPLLQAVFFGVKAAVLAVVVEAVLRIGRRILASRTLIGIAVAAFVAIFFLHVPFPLIVIGAGLLGWLGGRVAPTAFRLGGKAAGPVTEPSRPPSLGWALEIAAICLALWWLPVLAAWATGATTLTAIGLFFSKLAVVTFGGAYAVLAYMTQAAVQTYGWLGAGEMLDGLGLAETTPGPLILVTSFVGFQAAFHQPGSLPPLLAGTLGATLTVWVTFVPCFLWIFMGAPFIERLRAAAGLNAALSAITAAVVGVIANLAVWFGLHVLFERFEPIRLGPLAFDLPVAASLDPWALALAAVAMLALLRLHLGLVPVLAGSALLGVLIRTLV
ncbi:MAG: chromate efflux transporter [Geminicoccaceae bacterium]